jgi:arylformamidase
MTDPFRIRAHVPDFEAIAADYTRLSDAARAQWRSQCDVVYGDGPDERLDLFFPEQLDGPAPIHIFIHGGYWRANYKEDYAFIAAPVIAADGIAVIVDYSLMPKARMATLVDQVRRAAAWVADHAAEFGGDPLRISASGQSAGAHLAFYLGAKGAGEAAFPTAPVAATLLVSGVYDLAPIAESFLQAEIALTQEEIAAWSPIDATAKPGVAMRIVVGADETAPFHTQAAALAERNGLTVETLPGINHMTIARELGVVGSDAARILAEVVRAS